MEVFGDLNNRIRLVKYPHLILDHVSKTDVYVYFRSETNIENSLTPIFEGTTIFNFNTGTHLRYSELKKTVSFK